MKSKMQTISGKYWLQNGREVSFAKDISKMNDLIKFLNELKVIKYEITKVKDKQYYEPLAIEKRQRRFYKKKNDTNN